MSDNTSGSGGSGGSGFVGFSVDHPVIPDELRADVARLLDRATIADAYIDALKERLAALEAEAKQAREDEAWARSQFDSNGSVCVVFHPVSVTAKKFCGTGWAVVQHAETAAAALRALRANVKGGAR